jgi:hypothetical protein
MKMRILNVLTLSIAASLMVSAIAEASEAPDQGYAASRTSAAIQGVGLPWNLPGIQRVSPASAERYPKAHWTAFIGTGAAVAAQASVKSQDAASPVSALGSSQPHWTSAIGTGTAAALQHRGSGAGPGST